jgi:hypothetical protein
LEILLQGMERGVAVAAEWSDESMPSAA